MKKNGSIFDAEVEKLFILKTGWLWTAKNGMPNLQQQQVQWKSYRLIPEFWFTFVKKNILYIRWKEKEKCLVTKN